LFYEVLKVLRLCVIVQQTAGNISLFCAFMCLNVDELAIYIEILGVVVGQSCRIADILLRVSVALENKRQAPHDSVHASFNQTQSGLVWLLPNRICPSACELRK
jgi:hypothetical protein